MRNCPVRSIAFSDDDIVRGGPNGPITDIQSPKSQGGIGLT